MHTPTRACLRVLMLFNQQLLEHKRCGDNSRAIVTTVFALTAAGRPTADLEQGAEHGERRLRQKQPQAAALQQYSKILQQYSTPIYSYNK